MSERNVKAAWFHSDDDEWIGEIVLHDFDSAEQVGIDLFEKQDGSLTMESMHTTQTNVTRFSITPEDLFDFIKAKHQEASKEQP